MSFGALSTFAPQHYPHGRLPESALRWFLKPVLECLHYMHAREMVHLDVKADNIMVTWSDEHGRCGAQATGSYRFPVAKLGDFGSARCLDKNKNKNNNNNNNKSNKPTNPDAQRKRSSSSSNSSSHKKKRSVSPHADDMCCGTPGFMAPEIISHLQNTSDAFSPAADVWSFACTALQLLRGAPPVRPDTHVAAILFETAMFPERIQKFIPPVREPVSPTVIMDHNDNKDKEDEVTISASLRDLLLKCLHPDPKKRATTAELLQHPFFMKETRPEDIGINEENQPPLYYGGTTTTTTTTTTSQSCDTSSNVSSNIHNEFNSLIQCHYGGLKDISNTTGMMGSTLSTLFDGLSNSEGEDCDEGDIIYH
ncbi:Protein kinase domain protein [Trypanosoma theileri]|uniref:Protein kinase domain protein n=1 Tax=Trypanosoma theileri TaxID=67003 RepID=A0A1X0NQ47_9TRYP|nr:Protein kinase domain protein [Trypanosoma theileri]ORC86583.1 Protein kinase domain protein [Trypanosoma theileri]